MKVWQHLGLPPTPQGGVPLTSMVNPPESAIVELFTWHFLQKTQSTLATGLGFGNF